VNLPLNICDWRLSAHLRRCIRRRWAGLIRRSNTYNRHRSMAARQRSPLN
jgi:hypothetical protein